MARRHNDFEAMRKLVEALVAELDPATIPCSAEPVGTARITPVPDTARDAGKSGIRDSVFHRRRATQSAENQPAARVSADVNRPQASRSLPTIRPATHSGIRT